MFEQKRHAWSVEGILGILLLIKPPCTLYGSILVNSTCTILQNSHRQTSWKRISRLTLSHSLVSVELQPLIPKIIQDLVLFLLPIQQQHSIDNTCVLHQDTANGDLSLDSYQPDVVVACFSVRCGCQPCSGVVAAYAMDIESV